MEKNNPQDPTPQQTSDDQKIEELLTFITQTIKDLDERDQKLENCTRNSSALKSKSSSMMKNSPY